MAQSSAIKVDPPRDRVKDSSWLRAAKSLVNPLITVADTMALWGGARYRLRDIPQAMREHRSAMLALKATLDKLVISDEKSHDEAN
jgi:hypothetical protein